MIVQLNTSTLQLSVDYWKQERLIFRVPTGAGESIGVWSDLDSNLANYVGYGSTALIDLTDYARANADNLSTIYIFSDWNGDTWEIGFNVAGLISPDSVLKPDSKVFHFPIVAPRRYIGGEDTICEVYTDYRSPIPVRSMAWGWCNSQGVWNRQSLSDGLHSLQVDSTYKKIAFGNMSSIFPDSYTIIPIQKQECGVTYALVRWVSFTGRTKQHVFEVVKQKTNVREPYSLMPTDMEYIEIKGREDGFTLRLDGLDRYDLWYYSDLITSSKVQVDLGSGYTRVQVVSKSITLPDGEAGTNGVLEVQINWKRYDAVSM